MPNEFYDKLKAEKEFNNTSTNIFLYLLLVAGNSVVANNYSPNGAFVKLTCIFSFTMLVLITKMAVQTISTVTAKLK